MAIKKATKTDIRDDLLDQLERNGTVGKYYYDLVFDYMEMYDTKKKLITDIRKRGVSVEYNNGGGQKGFKKNDSVDQLLKVNQQMLKLLDALGIDPASEEKEDDEEM